jgi:predicted transcriptional regulator
MLTPLELDIMKAVWSRPPITVRDVQEAIRPSRNLAYTTVMTIMDRLYHKGFLTRDLRARAHYYRPVLDYTEARDEALNALIASFFGGSKEELQDYLSGNGVTAGANGGSQPPSPVAMDETLL